MDRFLDYTDDDHYLDVDDKRLYYGWKINDLIKENIIDDICVYITDEIWLNIVKEYKENNIKIPKWKTVLVKNG